MGSTSLEVETDSILTIYRIKFDIRIKASHRKTSDLARMGRRMDEKRLAQEDKELVLVAFKGGIANLETLVRLARECGFYKVLSALERDLQRAQADTTEIIAMAAEGELSERLQAD